MTLSVTVMAHPDRKSYVDELLPQLGREVTVVWDRRNDRWDTGRRSLLEFDPSATHHLVVQDDAIVPRDFVAGVENALQYADPTVPICLYTGKARPNKILVAARVDQAMRIGCSWIRMPGPWWGVGVVTPTVGITSMVEWCDTRVDIENYDLRMAEWWIRQQVHCLYTVPSLVDHRQGPSLVPNRGGKGRRAHASVLQTQSALDIKWSTRCLNAMVPEHHERGEVAVMNPAGVRSLVTKKAYRELLQDQGWVLVADGEASSLGEVSHV